MASRSKTIAIHLTMNLKGVKMLGTAAKVLAKKKNPRRHEVVVRHMAKPSQAIDQLNRKRSERSNGHTIDRETKYPLVRISPAQSPS